MTQSGMPIRPTGVEPATTLRWYQGFGVWYKENRFTYPIRRRLVQNRLAFRLIQLIHRYLGSRFITLREQLDQHHKFIGLLSDRADGGYDTSSQYGYSGDVFFRELETAHKYHRQIEHGFQGPSESKALYAHITAEGSSLLEATASPCFLNFGISFAYIDAALAAKFPNVQFFGIERTDAAKLYNAAFIDRENLTVLSGDVFDLLANRRFDGGVFFHTRTLLLLPETFVRKLYAAVRAAGFHYIFGVEQFGISRQTLQPYEFSLEPRDTVVYRGFMFIHNYPNLLRDAGFELTRFTSLATDHPHDDFRLLSFTARATAAREH